jgi:hydrogenase-4 component F
VTDLAHVLAALMIVVPALAAALVWAARTPRQSDLVARTAACATAAPALTLAILALAHGGRPLVDGRWLLIDRASGLLLAITGVIGLSSVLLSGSYLRTGGRSWLSATASHAWYYAVLLIFWAALLAAPVAGNLAVVWLIVDATTATSALMVSFSGRRDALEAAWKYLILTTLGLSLALLGIIVIAIAQAGAHQHGLDALSWRVLQGAARSLPRGTVLTGFMLLIAGLAAKIGWAPVHNWLPDAHSEAPAPASALLSAVLLPTVMLVAWRAKTALEPALGPRTCSALFIGFGLTSIIVAVPFLWQTLTWKRLLAYSSLEHMGIIAVGLGFGSPLAITGVVIHVAGHAAAKSLGFYASMPLPRAGRPAGQRAGGTGQTSRAGAAMGVSLVALAGLPPSPLFVSELLILLGGIASGHALLAAITAAGIALGFLGLLHALLEGVVGDSRATTITEAAL